FSKDKEIWIIKDSAGLAVKLGVLLQCKGYKTKVISADQKADNKLGALILCANAETDKQDLFDSFALVQRC
ncbi:MAG: hypothetical protein ACPHLK_04125, partial [Gammaproteobacteria bacterium]